MWVPFYLRIQHLPRLHIPPTASQWIKHKCQQIFDIKALIFAYVLHFIYYLVSSTGLYCMYKKYCTVSLNLALNLLSSIGELILGQPPILCFLIPTWVNMHKVEDANLNCQVHLMLRTADKRQDRPMLGLGCAPRPTRGSPEVTAPQMPCSRNWFCVSYPYPNCLSNSARKSIKIFWAQTFLTRSLLGPNFFKLNVPGGLRIFRAFASLFTYELVLAHVTSQTSYHEGTLGSVEELYYEETGKDGFFKYMSAPLAR